MEIAVLRNQPVRAHLNLVRALPYICPDCSRPTCICLGKVVPPYFRHVDGACNPVRGSPESDEHDGVKALVRRVCLLNGLTCESERTLSASTRLAPIRRRVDTLAHWPNYDGDFPREYAFEIQRTSISHDDALFGRILDYNAARLGQMWLPAVDMTAAAEHTDAVNYRSPRLSLRGKRYYPAIRYRTRRFEDHLAVLFGGLNDSAKMSGTLWFGDAAAGGFWWGHFWMQGHFTSGWRRYRALAVVGPFYPDELDIQVVHQPPRLYGDFLFPRCWSARFTPRHISEEELFALYPPQDVPNFNAETFFKPLSAEKEAYEASRDCGHIPLNGDDAAEAASRAVSGEAERLHPRVVRSRYWASFAKQRGITSA